MVNVLVKLGVIGRRLAEAGKQAKVQVVSAAGPVGGQVAEAAAMAAGELVRCAVAGAITAVIRGSRPKFAHRTDDFERDEWTAEDELDDIDETSNPPTTMLPMPVANMDITTDTNTGNTDILSQSRWTGTTKNLGSALAVAAGAAAAVPGGKVVAAGLGAVAAVVGLAVKTGESKG